MQQQQESEGTAAEIVAHLITHDRFSRWLGIRVMEIKEGYCRLQMNLGEDKVNGFGIVHGGILFSLADSAFAFACNSRNNVSLALEGSITITKPVQPHDVLTAEAVEVHNGTSTGLYLVTLTNQHNEQVALFKGICFRTGKNLI